MIINNNKQDQKKAELLSKMKKLAEEINEMKFRRDLLRLGANLKYASINELRKKQAEFRKLQYQHRELYFAKKG